MFAKVKAWMAVRVDENHSTLKLMIWSAISTLLTTPFGIEQQPPDDGDDHGGEQPGQDEEHPQDAANERIDAVGVQQQRKGQADDEVEDRRS